MGLGEKLWEEKSRSLGLAVRTVGAEGAVIEGTWTGELKGFGRMRGIDGTTVGTTEFKKLAVQTYVIGSDSHEVFTTKEGERVFFEGYSTGKIHAGRYTSGVDIITFRTDSKRLLWMNDIIVLREGLGGPDSEEQVAMAYEWVIDHSFPFEAKAITNSS